MRIGFAKVDITPRVGVQMAGFGPFSNRYCTAVRDRLWARAMAVELDGHSLVLISNDLIGVSADTAARVRALIAHETGIGPERVMVTCTHTHSGPATGDLEGWGAVDAPYLELLPGRIARAGLDAVEGLEPACLRFARVPCEGIGYNREYDTGPAGDECLSEDWRPEKPELTDTTCQVIVAESGARMLGFVSGFGCHPVVCCEATRYIHGDFPGVATNLLEREHPGAVGLFLQGAHGDVNTCIVHRPEPESMLALDIIAGRYARAVRAGLAAAEPIAVDCLRASSRRVDFSRRDIPQAEMVERLAEQERVLHAPGASDADGKVRMATVFARAWRRLLDASRRGEALAGRVEVQGFRLGPVSLLASPFETFQAIKNDVVAQAGAELPVVVGVANDLLGYAPDKTAAARGGYAADTVPLILGMLPFARAHEELVEALLGLDRDLAS